MKQRCLIRATVPGPLRPFAGDRLVPRSARRGRGHPAAAHAVAVGASLRLHCGARSEVAPPNSLRSLRSLRSDKRRRVSSRSALRAPTSNLRSSSPQKSPPPGTPCRSGSVGVLRPNTTDVAAKARPGRLRSASEAPSRRARTGTVLRTVPAWRAAGPPGPVRPARPGLVARARSAHQQLTCRRLFERSERSERSEFGDGPRDRAAQGSRRAAPTAEAKRSSLPGRDFAAPAAARKSARRTAATGRKPTHVHHSIR